MRLNTCKNCGKYDWACKGECVSKVEDENPKIVSVGGATSSELEYDFHDLPFAGVMAAARRFAMGRPRHGRFNWKKGNAEFAEARLNHMMKHAALFSEYRKQDDLDAVICNGMMLAHFMYTGVMSQQPLRDFYLQGKTQIQDVPNK